MRFDKEITSLFLLGLSVVVTVLAAITFGLIDSSTIMNALGTPPSHGFEMLQMAENIVPREKNIKRETMNDLCF